MIKILIVRHVLCFSGKCAVKKHARLFGKELRKNLSKKVGPKSILLTRSVPVSSHELQRTLEKFIGHGEANVFVDNGAEGGYIKAASDNCYFVITELKIHTSFRSFSSLFGQCGHDIHSHPNGSEIWFPDFENRTCVRIYFPPK